MKLDVWAHERAQAGTLPNALMRLYESGISMDGCLALVKQLYALEALLRHRGNTTAAAASLGVHRNTIRLLVYRAGLKPRDVREMAYRYRVGAQPKKEGK